MNNLYVQFINQGNLCRERHTPFYIFQNGLSTVWNKCKSDGEMVWLEPGQRIPDFKGSVYVSAWYYQDLSQTYKYAKDNPDSNVVIGGPIVHQIKDVPRYRLPNVEITTESAEDFFNVNPEWNVEIPQKYNDSHISWTYPIDSGSCYWGKCTFCRASYGERHVSKYVINNPIVETGKTKSIWLGSLCLSPKSLFNVLSVAEDRDDVFYLSYVRATKESANSIKYALKASNVGKQCVFVCGIEFPGNRMLKWMRKGITTENQLYFIEMLTELGCEINLNFIIDWIELKDYDLKEAENFFMKLKEIHNNNLSAKIYELHIVPSELMYSFDRDKIAVANTLGDSINYLPILTDKEKRLNKRLKEIYYSFPWISIDESSLNSQRPTR